MIARRFGTDKEVRQDMTGSFIEHGLNQAEVVDETMLQLYAKKSPYANVQILNTGV